MKGGKEKWLGKRDFQRLRKAKGYSQSQLARIFRVTVRTISRWETGERGIPHFAFLALEGLKRATVKGRGK